jgi:hypothetical protein
MLDNGNNGNNLPKSIDWGMKVLVLFGTRP